MADLTMPLLAFLGLWTVVVASLLLVKFSGIAPLSQGMVGGCTMLVLLTGAERLPALLALGLALAVAAAIGIVHLALLYRLRPLAFLLASAAFQIVFEQLWVALPSVTGGSGGLLLPSTPPLWLVVVLTVIVLATLCHALNRVSRPPLRSAAITLFAIGPASGAFGVNYRLLLGGAVTMWALAGGLWGVLTTASSGIMAPSNFEITWSITAFLIAIFSAARGQELVWSGGLTMTFVITRYGLSVYAYDSVLLANGFDIAFPLLVLGLVLATGALPKLSAR